jgi:cell wall-associated NlpC family hydrolase
MRITSSIVFIISLLFLNTVACAEGSVSEGLNQKVQPLLKALSLIGTPYKFGGTNPEKGVDCSGFVRHVYKESADIALPRSAKDMSQTGTAVSENELKPGDLVFFNTRKKDNSHVGIYAGNGEFVHASSSHTKKVTLSNLTDNYWSARFNGARRILTESIPDSISDSISSLRQ